MTMPYSKERHANQEIQDRVGLHKPNCQVPRLGDRTRIGAQGFNLVSCNSHMQPLAEQDAQLLWAMIPLHTYYFISFLNLNMDFGHRVKWFKLTGREQFEWYNAFIACGSTYIHHEVGTFGLRGTDPGRINVGQLQQAMLRSSSLYSCRPAAHNVPQVIWDNTRDSVRCELQF